VSDAIWNPTADEFVKYLRETLIPDLRESGHEFTAEDFETAVRLLSASAQPVRTQRCCPKCGCLEVEIPMWVKVNDRTVVDDYCGDLEVWCPRCQEHHDELPTLVAYQRANRTAVDP
jgi:thymidine kinase